MILKLRRHDPSGLLAGTVLLWLLLFDLSFSARAADAADGAWTKLRSGSHVALIRHALAPGFGDPDTFKISDCATQRNLSDVGRGQARRIGALFRGNGINIARVLTSQWCRCRETAALLGLGEPEDLKPLNSFFSDRSTEPLQTDATRRWLAARDPGVVHVLVTHQVNITALTGVVPASGEIVVARVDADGSVTPVDRIQTD